MTKQEIRKIMIKLRKSLQKDTKKRKNERIARTFIDLILKKTFKTVLLYAPFGSEVDTWRIFYFCHENSIRTAFPKVKGDDLEIYLIEDPSQLVSGYRGILEPTGGQKATVEEIDVIAVPGIAFDKNCYRIGYGGGFYDRLLLKKKGLAIGLAYEEQIIDKIPIEPFDKRLDLIITDERVISCV